MTSHAIDYGKAYKNEYKSYKPNVLALLIGLVSRHSTGHVRYINIQHGQRLSGQTSIFGVVFFVSKSLLGIKGRSKHEKFSILTRKPRIHARILIYRTWPIVTMAHVKIVLIGQEAMGRSLLYGLFKKNHIYLFSVNSLSSGQTYLQEVVSSRKLNLRRD